MPPREAIMQLLYEKTIQLIQVPRGAYDLCARFAYECKLLSERICCVKLLFCDKA